MNHSNHPHEIELSAFVDDEGATGRRAQVAHHIETCPSCRDIVASFRSHRRLIRSTMGVRLAEDFARATARSARERAGLEERWYAIEQTAQRVVVALIVIVVLAVAFGRQEPEQMTDAYAMPAGVFQEYIHDSTMARVASQAHVSPDDLLEVAVNEP